MFINNLEKRKAHVQNSLSYTTLDALLLYDHRHLPRWQSANKAYYRIPDINVITRTHIKDLNSDGACLFVSRDISANQRLELKIYLSEDRCFEATGTVVWKRTLSEEQCCAGVVFDTLPEMTQDLILRHAFEVY